MSFNITNARPACITIKLRSFSNEVGTTAWFKMLGEYESLPELMLVDELVPYRKTVWNSNTGVAYYYPLPVRGSESPKAVTP